MRRTAFAPILLLAALAAPALAIEGQRPIHRRTDIFQPGYYKLTRNVADGGSPVITVSVGPEDRVVIDLNCHTLTQLSTNVPVISISSGGNIVVKNGELQGGTYGIDVVPGFTQSLRVRDLTIRTPSMDGIRAAALRRLFVRDVVVDLAGGHGMNLEDINSVAIARYVAQNVGAHGLRIAGMSIPISGQAEKILVQEPGLDGVFMDGVRNYIFRTISVLDAGEDGMDIRNSRDIVIEALKAEGAARRAADIVLSEQILVKDITASGSGDSGVVTDSGSSNVSVIGGMIAGAMQSAMMIESPRTTVRDIELLKNAVYGLRMTSTAVDSVVRGTTGVGNGTFDFQDDTASAGLISNHFGTTGP